MVGFIAFLLATFIIIKLLIDLSLHPILNIIILLVWGFISSYSLYIFYRAEPVLGIMNMFRTLEYNQAIARFSWLGDFIVFLSRVAFNIMFGFLSIFLFPQQYRYKVLIYITSMVLLLILGMMYNVAMSKFINPPPQDRSQGISISGIVLVLTGIIGWFTLSVVLGFSRLLQELENQGHTTTQIVTPLIPGITLPFLESLIALGFVMVIHELAHAVIALRNNIPLKSTGLITYGAIPVGAFVEPDEKIFQTMQDRAGKIDILMAGVGVNIFFALVFFLMFWIFLTLTTPLAVTGSCVSNDIIPGKYVVIKKIDGVPCVNAFLSNNSTLETNHGTFVMNRYVKYSPLPSNSIFRIYDNFVLDFIYNLLFMLFALNLIIAITNMFPIYFIDGGQTLTTVLEGHKGELLLKIFTIALLSIILVSIVLSR
ncbi:MAG: site-2 protease family protein [Candidatus Micrarchaeota archaeon]|nr:site-2 protease family protein [Candidatus Micrarchaeota archaeon]